MTGINLMQRVVSTGVSLDMAGGWGGIKLMSSPCWKNLFFFHQEKQCILEKCSGENPVTFAFLVSFGEHWNLFF